MQPHRADRLTTRMLTALACFGALSAFIGAAMGIVSNGGGIPLEYLVDSPFRSYAVPGLILGLVVGGTQLAAAIALLSGRRTALLLSAVAGFGMLIWVFVELVMIRHYSWLQSLYFAHGALELVLVLVLLGVVPKRIIRS